MPSSGEEVPKFAKKLPEKAISDGSQLVEQAIAAAQDGIIDLTEYFVHAFKSVPNNEILTGKLLHATLIKRFPIVTEMRVGEKRFDQSTVNALTTLEPFQAQSADLLHVQKRLAPKVKINGQEYALWLNWKLFIQKSNELHNSSHVGVRIDEDSIKGTFSRSFDQAFRAI